MERLGDGRPRPVGAKERMSGMIQRQPELADREWIERGGGLCAEYTT